MSKIVLILLTFFLTSQALEWKSYEEALKIQKQNNKPIMIDVVRTHCHYCSDMQRNVFDNEAMSLWLEERFIPVKLNLDSQKLPLGLQVSFTPSFFFVNAQGEIIKKIPGAWNIEDFQSMTKDLK